MIIEHYITMLISCFKLNKRTPHLPPPPYWGTIKLTCHTHVPAIVLVHSVNVNPLPNSCQVYQRIQIHRQHTCIKFRHFKKVSSSIGVVEVQIKSVTFHINECKDLYDTKNDSNSSLRCVCVYCICR